MATLMDSLVAINFSVADAAAAASEADLPKQFGLPDLTDVIGILMPCAGAIVGLSVTGAPASGDTVTVTPAISTDAKETGRANVTALATTLTNAAPAASTIISKDTAAAQFKAGNFVSFRYITTTGGTYTTVDMNFTLWIQTGLEDL